MVRFFRWRPRGNPGSPEACDAPAGGPSSPTTATMPVTVVRGAPRDFPFALLIRRKSAAGSCQGLLGDGPTERCKDLSHCLGRLGV